MNIHRNLTLFSCGIFKVLIKSNSLIRVIEVCNGMQVPLKQAMAKTCMGQKCTRNLAL